MSSRTLVLVRHGVTDWNREGRFQGHLDPPLSEEGRRESRLLAARLSVEMPAPARVVASSLGRALETASILADGARGQPPVEPDARLMEVGQGEWEGRTHAELRESDAERYAAWRTHGGGDRQPPGGERLENVLARLGDLLDDLLAAEAWPVWLVSHGGTLRLLARHLLGLAPARAWALDLDNASLSVLSDAGGTGWKVERWNDTRHLLGRMPTHVSEAEGEPLAL